MMTDLASHQEILLAAGIALARGLDFLSTWIVTPTLALEANPLMRRLGWSGMLLLNLPLLALPWVHAGLSVTFMLASLLVAGTNLAHGALARGMGEQRQLESQMAALRRIGLGRALALNTSGMLIVAGAGALLMLLAGGPASLAWWGALGVLMCGAAGLVHLNFAIVRLHGRAMEAERRRDAERRAARLDAWRAREPRSRGEQEDAARGAASGARRSRAH
jgi:hypothetical protein